jgi:hypothetical protein
MEWLTNSAFLGPAPTTSSLSRFLIGPDAPPSSPAEEESTRIETAGGLNSDAVERAKQVVVPHWFTAFFNTGVVSVIGLNSLTLISASLNLAFSDALGESRVFYQIGLTSAVAHYVFVPLVGRSVRALVGLAAGVGKKGETEEGKAVDWVREWVGWHKIRMGTVDVVAWGCFAWGAVGALTA